MNLAKLKSETLMKDPLFSDGNSGLANVRCSSCIWLSDYMQTLGAVLPLGGIAGLLGYVSLFLWLQRITI